MMNSAELLLEDWEIAQIGSGRSTLTTTERIRVLTRFVSDTQLDPLKAQPRDISRWFARSRPNWSDSTIATYHSYFAAFYKWLQRQGLREDNPMTKLDAPRYPDREPRPVSDAALIQLLCTPMHTRTRNMILLATLAGLRVSEIAAIRGEDVDLGNQRIRIKGKGGKIASIPMHPLLVDIAERMPQRGHWFPSSYRPGECLYGKSVSQTVGIAMRRAGIAGTPHALRHWFASNLLASGADLLTIRELLRHSSVATTQIYTKVPDQRRVDAVGRLDPFRGRPH